MMTKAKGIVWIWFAFCVLMLGGAGLAVVPLAQAAASGASAQPARDALLLQAVLATRCGHFTGPFGSAAVACQTQAWRMVKAMGVEIVKGDASIADGLAAFPGELVQMAGSAEGQAYLEALSSAFEAGRVDNLYLWTRHWYHGDARKTLRAIAVLLQDSNYSANARYLEVKYGARFAHVAGLIREIGGRIREDSRVALYPLAPMPESRGQYHFYVIAYLALKLSDSATNDAERRMAAAVPFLFNTTYEFMGNLCTNAIPRQTREGPTERNPAFSMADIAREVRGASAAGGGGGIGGGGSWSGLLRRIAGGCWNPRRYDASTHEGSLRDIFLGYSGALWATGRFRDVVQYGDFVSGFASDPQGFIRRTLGVGR